MGNHSLFMVVSNVKKLKHLPIKFTTNRNVKVRNHGTVISVKDGVVQSNGLRHVKAGEMVKFVGKELYGMALNLEKNSVGIVIFGNDFNIKAGDSIITTGDLMAINVSDAILGRVVDALGKPIDGQGPIEEKTKMRIERKSPGIITRKSVHEPLQTGIKRETIMSKTDNCTIIVLCFSTVNSIFRWCVALAVFSAKHSCLESGGKL
jgi:F0F1-type ATP synthase alpha subunit